MKQDFKVRKIKHQPLSGDSVDVNVPVEYARMLNWTPGILVKIKMKNKTLIVEELG